MKTGLLILSMTLIFIFSGCIEIPATESQESTPQPTKPDFTEELIILKDNFLVGPQISPRVIELNRVQGWVHTNSKQLEFTSLNPPYVINTAIRKKTSEIKTSLLVRVYRKDVPYKMSNLPITSIHTPIQAFVIEEKGDYIIDVKSVGCEWQVLIGHESEGFRD